MKCLIFSVLKQYVSQFRILSGLLVRFYSVLFTAKCIIQLKILLRICWNTRAFKCIKYIKLFSFYPVFDVWISRRYSETEDCSSNTVYIFWGGRGYMIQSSHHEETLSYFLAPKTSVRFWTDKYFLNCWSNRKIISLLTDACHIHVG